MTEPARQAISFFLARLNSELNRLREITFPGHDVGPRKWLGFATGIIDTAQAYIISSTDAATPAIKAAQLVRDAEILGQHAFTALTHVAGADATQIPHQVVAPFQRWVRELGISNTLFFRAEHLPHYELRTIDGRGFKNLNNPSQSLIAAIDSGIEWPVLIVTVPGQAMGMLPHYAVVGHELGHAVQDNISVDFSAHNKAESDFVARLEARCKAHGIPLGQDEVLRVNAIVGKWVNELKADAVGHYVGGPAFFFALSGFLELALHSYGIADTHPPSDLRKRLLVRHLSESTPNFVDVFREETGFVISENCNSPNVPNCPPPDDLFDVLSKVLSKSDAAICVELIPYMNEIAPTIYVAAREYLNNTAPGLIYTPAQLKFDLETHLDELCALIPPIEYRAGADIHPTNLSSILNVGWAALLTRLDTIPEVKGSLGDSISRKMERLHELLLKAVELSEARRLWGEVQ